MVGRGMNIGVWGDHAGIVAQGVFGCVIYRYFVRICLFGDLLVGMD